MKILFLSSRIPYPPDRGDKVRTLFILRELAKMGEVTLMSMIDQREDAQSISAMQSEISDCHFVQHSVVMGIRNLLGNLLRNLPFQVAYYQNRQFKAKLADLTHQNHYDLVYIHLIRMVPYGQMVKGAKRILDYTDCISLEYTRSLEHLKGIKKVFFTIEAKRTARYEQNVANAFEENWIISPIDINVLGLKNHANSIIVPNQVAIPEERFPEALRYRLIFTGNMSVAHNVVAVQNVVQKIMPALLKKFPNLRFFIVGANPSPDVLAMDGVNSTKVVGFVPDLYEELFASDIFVAPMYFSAGIQNKALEAMACGIPVVTTPNVAHSLDAHDEVELMVAEDNNAFVKKVTQLLEDKTTRQQIGRSGRSLVLSRFSNAAIKELIQTRVNRLLHT